MESAALGTMTRRSKVREDRLVQLEAEFEPLLISCLLRAAEGRYGLFGQNDGVDPEDRYWPWTEAQRVVEMAEEIQELRSESGGRNELAEKLMYLRSLRGRNVPGEPKLAKAFLEELQ